MIVELDDIESYRYVVAQGYEPLLDRRFSLEIHLRVEVQRILFGGLTDHEKFYRWVWEHKPHICEETMRPLNDYSAVHISHILTKGGFPEMAHDPRNTNILCLAAHNKWEFGRREEMRIFESNQFIIQKLKLEYAKL